jgi:NAD dependent epimerase/dehydratase family enzyme
MAREMVLASQRALPARLVDLGHRFSQPDIDGALGSLVGR